MTATLSTPPRPVSRWTEIDWRPRVHDRLIDGRSLRYLDYGSGPPLMLLHGLGCSWQ